MDTSQIAAIATNTSDPRAGLRAVTSLRVLADTLELRQVEAALRAGMNWQDIADALGLTPKARAAAMKGAKDDAVSKSPLDELRARRAARQRDPKAVDAPAS